MAQDSIETFRVGPTVPSRPSKMMVVVLAAFVVGFFTLVFTHNDVVMQAERQGGASSTAATQPAK